jgi:hypothetical protein
MVLAVKSGHQYAVMRGEKYSTRECNDGMNLERVPHTTYSLLVPAETLQGGRSPLQRLDAAHC